jgi:Fic family protein
MATSIPAESNRCRALPDENLARNWHREMVDGSEVPDEAYRGGFRGDAHPALVDFEVTIGKLSTTRASDVGAEISKLITELQERVAGLDKLDAQEEQSILGPDFVKEVLDTAAWLHCEWVRIHPFINGNGRTARMWILWLCGRYGLPQVLPLRPRPEEVYDKVTQLGVAGRYSLFLQYLLVQYNRVTASL